MTNPMTTDLEQLPELPEPEELLHSPMHGHVYGYTAKQMRAYALAALSQSSGADSQKSGEGVALPRYFADGPQGHFFADDLQLARDLVNLYDKQDDWTITDLTNPTGTSPAPEGSGNGND